MSSYSIAKKTGYLMSAQWIKDLLYTAFVILIARHSPTEYGQFMIALNLGQILLFTTEFGTNQHLTITLADRPGPSRPVVLQSLVVKLLIFAVAWPIMMGFCFWEGYSSELIVLVAIIATTVGLEAFPSSFYTAYRFLGRQDAEARIRTGSAMTGYGYGITSVLAGLPLPLIALYKPLETSLSTWITFRNFLKKRHASPPLSLPRLWTDWRGSAIFMGMSISAILYNRINLFFIKNHSGLDGVAQYSATWQVVDGISVLASGMLLGRVLFPIFARLWKTSQEEFTRLSRSSAVLLLAAALPVLFVLTFESDLIIGAMFGDEFGTAAAVQPLLCWCILFAFLHNLCAYLMASMKQQNLLFGFYLTGLVLNIVLCLTLIPENPIQGGALCIVLTKGAVALLSVGYCQIKLRLITLRTAAIVSTAIGMALGLRWVGLQSGISLLGTIFGLVPLVVLLVYLWRTRPRMKPRSQ